MKLHNTYKLGEITKKLTILIASLVILFNNIACVSATNKYIYSDGTIDYSITTKDTEDEFKVYYSASTGESHIGVFDKDTDILFLDNEVVEYNIEDGTPVNPGEDILKSSSDWTPVKVGTGYKISCKQAFKTTGQITTAIITAAGAVVGAHLGYTFVGTVIGDLFGQWVGDGIKQVNVIFKYDLYKTKNPVYVNSGDTVKTTGYRYQNYSATATFSGKTIAKTTTVHGPWWSASKPF